MIICVSSYARLRSSLRKSYLTNNGSSRSWRFVKVKTAGPVTFKSSANKIDFAQKAGLTNISVVNNDDGSNKGLADYAIDLSK